MLRLNRRGVRGDSAVRMTIGMLVVSGLAVSCSSGDSPPIEQLCRVASPLQGTLNTDTAWVVGIQNQHTGVKCTGTLITPNLVLTTRHCLDLDTDKISCTTELPELSAPEEIYVAACADMVNTGASPNCAWRHAVKLQRPGDHTFCGSDIALVIFDEPIPAEQALPAIPRFAPLHPGDIETFTTFGYGSIVPDPHLEGGGLRRRRDGMHLTCLADVADCTGVIGAPLDPREFVSESPGVCPGDSGGPAVAFGPSGPVIFGIISRANRDSCIGSIYTRVDAWTDFIVEGAQKAAEYAHTMPDWALTNQPDGASCSRDGACHSGHCQVVGAQQICVTPCGPNAEVCGIGMSCIEGQCASAPLTAAGGCASSASSSGGASTGGLSAFALLGAITTWRRRRARR